MERIKNLLIVLVVTAAAPSALGGDEPVADANHSRQAIVQGNNRFAIELYSKLRQKRGNLFCSPYSISTALAMACAGASGQTEQQMIKAMHFPIITGTKPDSPSKPLMRRHGFHEQFGAIITDLNGRTEKGAYELNVANALWGQKGCRFLKEFIELVQRDYDGHLNEVDFVHAAEAARKKINTWVQEQTKDKIKDLIPPGTLNQLTRLVLTNAIYFKGNWARQFEKDRTREAPFTLSGGEKVDVPMMNQTERFGYFQSENLQVLELPYVDNELSMIVFLPKEADGLGQFEKELNFENISERLGKIRRTRVVVSVPRFKITSEFGLADVLRSMGMEDAFTDKADFSGMNGAKDLHISAVLHKAYVDVNEEGTEAAAATGVVVGITSVQPQPPVFLADHPFLFLIRDNLTGSILFIGRVANPKAQG
jgi:serpin B